jgi:streptomycin 6-kinase
MTGTVRLQPLTRARVTSLGDRGADWAERLPGVLAGLAHDWGLDLGRALPGGSNSYVVRAVTAAGSPAVVKVVLDDDGLADQARVLADADGRGYARLLHADLDRGALQTEADKAVGLAGLITDHWERLGRPCPVEVRDQALRYAEALADAPAESLVVVHGDAHPGNALAVPRHRPGAETGYCFVDPDGFVADRAYDLGVAMRDFSATVLREGRPTLESYARLLAGHTGVDATRIWQWAFLERVSTGLYVLGFGAEPVARPYLESAEVLLDAR